MTFQWPLLLLSLGFIPVLIASYVLAQRRRRAYAVRFTNLALLREVAGPGPGIRRHIPPLLFIVGMAALLLSLARPMAVIAVPRDQTTAMLVLDVSGSMMADDLQPNRMDAAKEAARAFVEALPDEMQVGLVTFSSSAYLNTPPTHDHEQVLLQIDRLRSDGGTAIGEGLFLAVDQLLDRPVDENGQVAPALVVLLSDGESAFGRDPEEAATYAQDREIKVHTVGIGQRGATVMMGNQRVRLDERTLQGIAEATGGEYFYAGEANELEAIYSGLGSQVSWVEERTEVTALVSAVGAACLVLGGMLGLRWFQQFP